MAALMRWTEMPGVSAPSCSVSVRISASRVSGSPSSDSAVSAAACRRSSAARSAAASADRCAQKTETAVMTAMAAVAASSGHEPPAPARHDVELWVPGLHGWRSMGVQIGLRPRIGPRARRPYGGGRDERCTIRIRPYSPSCSGIRSPVTGWVHIVLGCGKIESLNGTA